MKLDITRLELSAMMAGAFIFGVVIGAVISNIDQRAIALQFALERINT